MTFLYQQKVLLVPTENLDWYQQKVWTGTNKMSYWYQQKVMNGVGTIHDFLVPTKSLTGTNRFCPPTESLDRYQQKVLLVPTESLDWYQQNVLLVPTESHEWYQQKVLLVPTESLTDTNRKSGLVPIGSTTKEHSIVAVAVHWHHTGILSPDQYVGPATVYSWKQG